VGEHSASNLGAKKMRRLEMLSRNSGSCIINLKAKRRAGQRVAASKVVSSINEDEMYQAHRERRGWRNEESPIEIR